METKCAKSVQDGEHRLEFRGDSGGVALWLCLNCGEMIPQYQDHQGC